MLKQPCLSFFPSLFVYHLSVYLCTDACMYVCVFQLTCSVSTMTSPIFSLIKYLIFSVPLTLRRWPPLLFYRGHRRYWIKIHTYFYFSIYIPHPAYLTQIYLLWRNCPPNANPQSINLTTIPFHFRCLNIHFLAIWRWWSSVLGPFLIWDPLPRQAHSYPLPPLSPIYTHDLQIYTSRFRAELWSLEWFM